MIKIYALVMLSLSTCVAFSQTFTIRGQVKDTQGEVVPFASVYLKGTTIGTSANIDGRYALRINKGALTFVYKAVGYKPQENIVNLNADVLLNVSLTPESYTLDNVTIRANAEDPAYAIMRKAIKARKKHLDEVNAYSCDVYIKGVQKLVGAPKKFMGRDIRKTLELDSNRKGIIYLSESESKFSFRRPNQIHEEMISSRISGRDNGFSFNKASDLIINFYNNYLLENTLSSRGFISPLADNAMFYYRYKYLGETTENGSVIHKIEVTPRRESDPVFRGVIYIMDDAWRIYDTDLFLTKNAGINFIDTLKIKQSFTKVEDVYMPTVINFQFNGNVLGFKFAGYYVGVYSHYNLNPNFPKNFFSGEILKITKLVNKKDSAYWNANRPIPLTPGEQKDYRKKDSISILKQSKAYLDSVEKDNNKFSAWKLLWNGYQVNDRFNKKSYSFDPLLRSVFYNTVEGFVVKYGVTYQKSFENNVNYSIRPEFRYGFANQKLSGSLTGNYFYDPVKRASIGGSFGGGVFDLNNLGSMTLLGNSINGLFYKLNYSKFYYKRFANIYTTRELASGLQGSLNVDYSNNETMVNHTSFTILDRKNLIFTSNNPFTPAAETPLFPHYQSFSATANLTYTIGQKYITRPDGKFYTSSKYPRISLTYKKGFKNVLSSDVDYDFVKAEVSQDRIGLGLWGYTSFLVGAGKFLNHNSLYYLDYKHFAGNISTIFPPDLRKFQYLDFYQFSTNEQYFEAHLEHNFAGFFINKIPLVRKLKLEEFVGGAYLSTPEKKNYKEFYVGLQRFIFRASYGFSYDGNKKISQGFRLSYGF
ncbi:MAG: carboxypeptidase-like regulatory domain-containing protein [Pedobacter sp.]|nr:carboxypeptidase-like regulatory domain-containing protein [Pedobacter sp.]